MRTVFFYTIGMNLGDNTLFLHKKSQNGMGSPWCSGACEALHTTCFDADKGLYGSGIPHPARMPFPYMLPTFPSHSPSKPEKTKNNPP